MRIRWYWLEGHPMRRQSRSLRQLTLLAVVSSVALAALGVMTPAAAPPDVQVSPLIEAARSAELTVRTMHVDYTYTVTEHKLTDQQVRALSSNLGREAVEARVTANRELAGPTVLPRSLTARTNADGTLDLLAIGSQAHPIKLSSRTLTTKGTSYSYTTHADADQADWSTVAAAGPLSADQTDLLGIFWSSISKAVDAGWARLSGPAEGAAVRHDAVLTMDRPDADLRGVYLLVAEPVLHWVRSDWYGRGTGRLRLTSTAEYEMVDGVPFPARLVTEQYMYLPDGTQLTAITHEAVVTAREVNPELDEDTFVWQPVPAGVRVEDRRFDPPLSYIQTDPPRTEESLVEEAAKLPPVASPRAPDALGGRR